MKGTIAVVLTGVVAAVVWLQFRNPDGVSSLRESERGESQSGVRDVSEPRVPAPLPDGFVWVSRIPAGADDASGYRLPLVGSPIIHDRIQEWVISSMAIGDEAVASARKANGAITKDQSLSPFAARTLEMSAEEEAAVNAALESYFAACGEWVSENLVVDEEASGEEIVYRFSASPAEAEARLHALKNGLTETLGSERGIRLLNMIPLLHYYGGAGLFDVEVKMWHFVSDTPLPEDDSYYDPHGLQFSMNVLNPMPNHGPFTGKGGSYRRFVEPYFGKEVFAHLIAGKESETGAPEATEGAEPSGGP